MINIKYKFIAIDGPDGVGKTTIARELYKRLLKFSNKIFLTKEPTDLETGVFVKNILNDIDIKRPSSNYALACLFTADRYLHQNIIQEKLSQGYIVITDRYYYSSYVYQNINNNFDIEWLKNINKYLMKPDITFIIRASEENIIKRLSKRKELNIYEREYIKKVIKLFDDIGNILKDENIIYISNDETVEDAVDDIMMYLLEI